MSETKRKVYPDRTQEAVKVADAARVKNARKQSPAASVQNADGTSHVTPNKHGKTRGYDRGTGTGIKGLE